MYITDYQIQEMNRAYVNAWQEAEERLMPHELTWEGKVIAVDMLTAKEADEINGQYRTDGIDAMYREKEVCYD